MYHQDLLRFCQLFKPYFFVFSELSQNTTANSTKQNVQQILSSF